MHIVVLLALIETEGTTDPMVIVIEFEVAVVGEAQASDEVSTQLTTSPLASDEVVNVALLVPALAPLIFH